MMREMPSVSKAAAHKAVRLAVRRGLLTRPRRCESCNKLARVVVAHHESYEPAQRLIVRWLCQSCHIRLHNLSNSSPSDDTVDIMVSLKDPVLARWLREEAEREDRTLTAQIRNLLRRCYKESAPE